MLGYLGEEPVGVLQLDAASGWISLLGIRPDCRRRGFGVQLIGQAVQQTRAAGGGKIFAALPENGEDVYKRQGPSPSANRLGERAM